jgi:hypothetical protein
MYVCMYVYIYVCEWCTYNRVCLETLGTCDMYVYMYVCMYVCMHARMYVNMYM